MSPVVEHQARPLLHSSSVIHLLHSVIHLSCCLPRIQSTIILTYLHVLTKTMNRYHISTSNVFQGDLNYNIVTCIKLHTIKKKRKHAVLQTEKFLILSTVSSGFNLCDRASLRKGGKLQCPLYKIFFCKVHTRRLSVKNVYGVINKQIQWI